MYIRFQDIGCPTFAGVFPAGSCFVTVEMQHLAVWKAYPAAVFETSRTPRNSPGHLLTLVRWSVPGGEVVLPD